MKNVAKNSFSLLLALLLVVGLSLTASAAESSVTFEDGKIIAFEPGSVYTDTDLFDNFKGVMPGDVRAEEITVQNNTDDCDYIRVYMRAILHDETGNPISENVLAELQADGRREADTELEYMYDFLSQLSMRVWNGSTLIYEESPDMLDGLAENVYLGTLRKGQTLTLDVELVVPVAMGNDYSDRIGEMDWVFVIEGFDDPVPPPDDDTMHTVRKVWVDDGVGRPESITVSLLRNGIRYLDAELNQANQWTYTWSRLSGGYTWSVVEAGVPSGYEATYAASGSTTTIINTAEDDGEIAGDTDKPEDISVTKVWSNDSGKNRPESVKVTLYDGQTAVESVWLGGWNSWSYTWRNLDGNKNWQVVETAVPKGYTPSYYAKNGVITITNTKTLIQTGQLNWPIPVLSGLGVLLIAYGIYAMTQKKKNGNA